jgi:hypothetical protein
MDVGSLLGGEFLVDGQYPYRLSPRHAVYDIMEHVEQMRITGTVWAECMSVALVVRVRRAFRSSAYDWFFPLRGWPCLGGYQRILESAIEVPSPLE